MTAPTVTVQHFAGDQNLVFVPALLVLLVATVLICTPIVFAPSMRRSKRRAPVLVIAGVLAAVALAGAALLAVGGFRALADERTALQADLRAQYGVRLDAADVDELINGGKPQEHLPAQAAAAGLSNPQKAVPIKLAATAPGADTYRLLIGGKPWPA